MAIVTNQAQDNTIIATAIPKITDQFRSLNDVGWYGSAYLLTTCATQLIYGKFYTFYSIKWVYLIALFIFEVGSLICGVAPNSMALIIGRAVAGVGAAGIFSGAILIIANTVPLRQRPAFMGLVGGVYGLASVAGPLVSGPGVLLRILWFADHGTKHLLILTLDGWSFYRPLDLALVFLHQPALRRCHGGLHRSIFPNQPPGQEDGSDMEGAAPEV
jgi:MFS family permease